MNEAVIRAIAEAIYEYPNEHNMRPSVDDIAAIISKHLPPPQPTLQQAIECVRDYRKWYDEKMFTPVTTEETQAVHKQFDGMVDRISAAMARHLIDKLIEQLESLASTQPDGGSELREIRDCDKCDLCEDHH